MFAFDCLYYRYNKRIHRFLLLILKIHVDAENVVQDVYLNLWINRYKIEKRESVRYYLFTSAYHSAISLLRKRLKESRFLENLKTIQKENTDQSDSDSNNEKIKNLYKVIETLPERQKEVYIMHGMNGLKYSEISEKLKITEKTVENHITRALKSIRNRLTGYQFNMLLF